MKSPLLILALLFSSIFSLSAQTRLGTVPRSINRADNPYYALDSILLGEEYSNTYMGVAMITKNALGGSAACLRSNYDSVRKRYELVYLVYNHDRKGREKVITYRCTIPSDTFLELSELITNAVYASAPGSVVFGAVYMPLPREALFLVQMVYSMSSCPENLYQRCVGGLHCRVTATVAAWCRFFRNYRMPFETMILNLLKNCDLKSKA